MNTLRRSLFKPNANGSNLNVSASSKNLNNNNKKRSSLRNLAHSKTDTTTASDYNLGSIDALSSSTKAARLQHHLFFPSKTEIINLTGEKEQVDLRIQVHNASSIRASLMRPKKQLARLALGDGCLLIEIMNSGQKLMKELTLLKDIMLTNANHTEFALFFSNDPNTYLIKPTKSTALDWIRMLFVELRGVALVLNGCLEKLLPEDWKIALQTGSHNASTIALENQNEFEEIQVPVKKFAEADMNKAELCLRELVDLLFVCRGEKSMELLEAKDRLGKWLEFNGKAAEGRTWTYEARDGYLSYAQRRKMKLESDVKTEAVDPLEGIRNPIALEQVVRMRQEVQELKAENRVEAMLTALDNILWETSKSGKDVYEEMI